MLHSLKKTGLIVVVLFLLFTAGGCHIWVPLPPHSYVVVPGRTHYVQPIVRARHHYRYFPASQVYYDTTKNIYFYQTNNIWLSATLLPRRIHIDLHNFVAIELDSPKPYVNHRKMVKRYPPGLQKEKHRRQREKQLEKKRQEEQLNRKKERLEKRKKEKELEKRKNKPAKGQKEKDHKKAIWK